MSTKLVADNGVGEGVGEAIAMPIEFRRVVVLYLVGARGHPLSRRLARVHALRVDGDAVGNSKETSSNLARANRGSLVSAASS